MNNLLFLVRTLISKNPKGSRPHPHSSSGNTASKIVLTELGSALKQYFTILVLFYLYMGLLYDNGIVMMTIFQYIPFAIATYLLLYPPG